MITIIPTSSINYSDNQIRLSSETISISSNTLEPVGTSSVVHYTEAMSSDTSDMSSTMWAAIIDDIFLWIEYIMVCRNAL